MKSLIIWAICLFLRPVVDKGFNGNWMSTADPEKNWQFVLAFEDEELENLINEIDFNFCHLHFI